MVEPRYGMGFIYLDIFMLGLKAGRTESHHNDEDVEGKPHPQVTVIVIDDDDKHSKLETKRLSLIANGQN